MAFRQKQKTSLFNRYVIQPNSDRSTPKNSPGNSKFRKTNASSSPRRKLNDTKLQHLTPTIGSKYPQRPSRTIIGAKRRNRSEETPLRTEISLDGKNKDSSRRLQRSSSSTHNSARSLLIYAIQTSFKLNRSVPPTDCTYYQVSQRIGKGAFGKVYRATHILTGLDVAIKTIDKAFLIDERSKMKLSQEVGVMKKVNHPHVVQLLEVFETNRFFMMVLEYAKDGDMLQLVKSKGYLTECEAKPIFKQIVLGLQGCHVRGVIHRDIKLDNILLTSEKQVKICDFGVSRTVTPNEMITEQCGTPAYLAPEIIINRGYIGPYVDIWSLGVLLYAILVGSVPFKAPSLKELHKLILTREFSIPNYLSADVHNLIDSMIQSVPFKRISIEDILAHPWLTEFKYVSHSKVESLVRKNHVIKQVTDLGYPKKYLIECLSLREMNHATATYKLLELNYHS